MGFALLHSVIGLENSRHPLSQSDAKLKPIMTWSLAFSRASGRLHVFTLTRLPENDDLPLWRAPAVKKAAMF